MCSILSKILKIKYPNGLVCPHCNALKTLAPADETISATEKEFSPLHRCQKCWHSFSVLGGSIMENSNLPLTEWDKLFHSIGKSGNISTIITTVIDEIGSPPTCSRCLRKLSKLVAHKLPKLSGTVAVDIVDFPPVVYWPLKQKNPQSILAVVMAETHHEGKIIVRLVHQTNAEIICSAIASHVMPGTIVKTGCWSGFEDLKEKGLKVEMANPIPRMYDVMATVMPLFPTCQNGLARFVKWLGDGWTNLPFETMQLYLPFFNIHSAMNFENPEIAYDFLLKAALTTSNEQLQRIR